MPNFSFDAFNLQREGLHFYLFCNFCFAVSICFWEQRYFFFVRFSFGIFCFCLTLLGSRSLYLNKADLFHFIAFFLQLIHMFLLLDRMK
ncbi:hypothetical protein CW304_02020 [Bacillus sp. UFRGS-B20]|nr:hypothetical protein CW304_02020 [Bacillus sp. UFRGS-B20]